MRASRNVAAVALMIVGDVVLVALCYTFAYWLRSLVFGRDQGVWLPSLLVQHSYLLAVYPLMFAYEGLYTKRLAGWEEVKRCLRGLFVATAAVMVILFALRLWVVSRAAVLLVLVLGMLIVPWGRAMLRRLLVVTGLWRRQLVLVGARRETELFRRELDKHRLLGYSVAAVVEPDGPFDELMERAQLPVDGMVVVFSDSFDASQLAAIFRHAERRYPDFMVVPNVGLLESSPAEVNPVGNMLVMKYSHNLLRPVNTITKRVLETLACVLFLMLLAPLLALVGLLVKLTSPGPVLFRQTRIGRGSMPFQCLKFRTMYRDAEQRLDELVASDANIRREWETYARITDDPRVTRLGRFLRRFSIDEWPQLWNVVLGDMSLVGPRPYLPRETAQIGDYLDTIVRVRPGLTGLWQVSGRADLPFRERVLLDEYYIRNWSLWLDFSIMLRTIWAVISARGAY